MKDKPVQAVFFDREVWMNQLMDKLRETECLCFNCANLKPDQADNCEIAQSYYESCVRFNTALAVTRCPEWKPKD